MLKYKRSVFNRWTTFQIGGCIRALSRLNKIMCDDLILYGYREVKQLGNEIEAQINNGNSTWSGATEICCT